MRERNKKTAKSNIFHKMWRFFAGLPIYILNKFVIQLSCFNVEVSTWHTEANNQILNTICQFFWYSLRVVFHFDCSSVIYFLVIYLIGQELLMWLRNNYSSDASQNNLNIDKTNQKRQSFKYVLLNLLRLADQTLKCLLLMFLREK